MSFVPKGKVAIQVASDKCLSHAWIYTRRGFKTQIKLHEHRSDAKSNMIETDHAKMALQGSAKKEVEFEHWNSSERINTHQTIRSFRRQIKSSHK